MNLKLSDTTINTFKLISCLSSKLLYSFVIIQQKLLILKRGRNSAVSLGEEGINKYFLLPTKLLSKLWFLFGACLTQ